MNNATLVVGRVYRKVKLFVFLQLMLIWGALKNERKSNVFNRAYDIGNNISNYRVKYLGVRNG